MRREGVNDYLQQHHMGELIARAKGHRDRSGDGESLIGAGSLKIGAILDQVNSLP